MAWYGKTKPNSTKARTLTKQHKKTKARFSRLLVAWKQRRPILVLALNKFVTYLLRHLSLTYSPGTHIGRTVLIIFPLILQTIIIAQMMSTGWEGDNDLISPQKSTINTGVTPNINLAIDSFPLTRLFPNTSPIFGQFTHRRQIPGQFWAFPSKWSPCYEAYTQHLNTAASLLSSLIHTNKLDQKWTHSLYVILRRETCSIRSKAHSTAMHILKLRQY